MTSLEYTGFFAVGSFFAGMFGSLTGLGGGVILIPLLTLVFGVDLRYAIGASLISVIATSSGAAAAYVREGFTNLRLGMFLEVATTLGAVGGAYLAHWIPVDTLGIIFGVFLIFSAIFSWKEPAGDLGGEDSDSLAKRLRLNSSYPVKGEWKSYGVKGVPAGFSLMAVAGALSGMLGVGSGAAKVLAMDKIMRVPFKVSTTTSNFMIGVTAAASAGIYLSRGYIDPLIAMPVMIGVLSGSMLGAKILMGAKPRGLRILFAIAILLVGLQMIHDGFKGRF